MGNYSKIIGSLIGGVAGILVSAGLPAEAVSPEIQSAIVVILSAAATYIFPANTG